MERAKPNELVIFFLESILELIAKVKGFIKQRMDESCREENYNTDHYYLGGKIRVEIKSIFD